MQRTRQVIRRSRMLVVPSVFVLLLAGCASGGDPGTGSSAPAASPASPDAGDGAAGSTEGGGEQDLAAAEFDVTWKDALATAQDRFAGDPTSIGLDWETSEFAYTVELVSETEEYEVEISATSGDVVSESTDRLEADDAAEAKAEVFDPSQAVDVKDAMAAAVKKVDGRVTEWDLDGSARGLFYEVNVQPPGGADDSEVHVDARTGEVVGADS